MKRSKCYWLGILALMCLIPINVFAQSLTVEGVARDEVGEPLIVAPIIVQGLKTGVVADFDGHPGHYQTWYSG